MNTDAIGGVLLMSIIPLILLVFCGTIVYRWLRALGNHEPKREGDLSQSNLVFGCSLLVCIILLSLLVSIVFQSTTIFYFAFTCILLSLPIGLLVASIGFMYAGIVVAFKQETVMRFGNTPVKVTGITAVLAGIGDFIGGFVLFYLILSAVTYVGCQTYHIGISCTTSSFLESNMNLLTKLCHFALNLF